MSLPIKHKERELCSREVLENHDFSPIFFCFLLLDCFLLVNSTLAVLMSGFRDLGRESTFLMRVGKSTGVSCLGVSR